LRDERRIDSVYESGQVIDQFATHERVGTVYFGGSRGLRDGWATRWTTGVSVDQRWATALPNAPPGSPLPKDRDLGKVAKGFEPDHRQTLLVSGGAAGRVEQGQLTDTVFSAAARYYWRHSSRRSLYVGLSADHGIRLDIDSQLTLGGDNGLRGYPYRFQTGQSRWLFTAKERWFTDWYPFRLFHVGGAVFYDMGRPRAATLSRHPPRSRSRTRRACCGMSASDCASASADRPSALCCTSTSHTRSTG